MKSFLSALLLVFSIFLTSTLITTAYSTSTTATGEGSGENTAKALFAGGCFWCMEKPFEKLDGVISVISGYSGGTQENPTYQNYGKSGHIEVVQITYNPEVVNYAQLLDVFWRQIDPTDKGGQFVDRGHEYSTGIFYYNDTQK